MKLEDLIGKSLDGFEVKELTEIYRTNDDGTKTKVIAYLQNETIAAAFAKSQNDPAWHRTQKVLVLTDGKVGFLLGEMVKISSDEKAKLEAREKALAKLLPEDRKLLGL